MNTYPQDSLYSDTEKLMAQAVRVEIYEDKAKIEKAKWLAALEAAK